MLAGYAIAYFAAGLAFAALDALWLSRMGPTFYRGQIGALMADTPDFGAAVAFYLIFVAAIVFFAIAPAFGPNGGWRTALVYGSALGFVAYATYDLSNMATLRGWPLKLTLVDMAWGTVLTGTSATVGYLVTKAVVMRS